jgi:bacterial/archaeal transporter family-2 protein
VDRGLAVVLTVIVGGFLGLQSPINSGLGKVIGNQQAAFWSFATGTIILAVIAGLVRGGYGQMAEVKSVAPQYLIGGVLGACYVSTVLVTVRTLGGGGIVAASIAGQLTMGVIVDQFGLLGLDRDPISVSKAIGVLLLAAGTLLVIRG